MNTLLVLCSLLIISPGRPGARAIDGVPFRAGDATYELGSRPQTKSEEGFPVRRRGHYEVCADETYSGGLQEFMVDTSTTYVAALEHQVAPCAAFDGTNYLIVWADSRSGVDYDIYGARVDSAGNVLDPGGIAISTVFERQVYPCIEFGDTGYLVVWQDYRSGSSHDIYGARISQGGEVVDSSGILISAGPRSQEFPSVGFDGTNYLVVWVDSVNGTGYDIFGARVSQSGTVLDPSAVPISSDIALEIYPSVSFDGTNYLAVWQHWSAGLDHDIHGARVGTTGVRLDSVDKPISVATRSQRSPSVAFDGTKYLVVWDDFRNGNNLDIYGSRVDTSGAALDPSGVIIADAAAAQGNPSALFDGMNFFVVWEDSRDGVGFDIYGARLDTSGALLDPIGIPISTAPEHQMSACVASNGTHCLVAWKDLRGGNDWDIYSVRVDSSGSVLDTSGILVATSAHQQGSPSVAFDSTNYFTVWADNRDGDFDIYGARVSKIGTILDPSGINIWTALGNQDDPCVTFGNTDYVVVWSDHGSGDSSDIYAVRVSQSGELLDTAGIAVSKASLWQEAPAASFDGTNYLVVWEDVRSGIRYDIYGTRIDTSGTVLDTAGIAISTAPLGQWSPCVGFNGTNWLVVWQDTRGGTDWDIYGTRVDASGSVLDTSGIPISTSSMWSGEPSVASNGDGYLVVWEYSDDGLDWDIAGARIDASGAVLDPTGIPVSIAPGSQLAPSLAFDGTEYVVVWHDNRNGSEDIYCARVDTSGTVRDPSGIELIDQSYYRTNPNIVAGVGGELFLVHEGFAAETYNSQRTFGALYTSVGVQEQRRTGSKMENAELFQNQPNPFNSQTTIAYRIGSKGDFTVKVYDSAGRLVRVLVERQKPGRRHVVVWDGRNSHGQEMPSGVYFYNLEAPDFGATRKMILIR